MGPEMSLGLSEKVARKPTGEAGDDLAGLETSPSKTQVGQRGS